MFISRQERDAISSGSGKGTNVLLTVAIATAGRRETVADLIAHLGRQTRLPNLLAICPASEDDVDRGLCQDAPFPVEIIIGPKGLTSQRNALLASTPQSEVTLFFDDDFVPDPTYLAQCEAVFEANPDVVMMTGHVIADGILGVGFTLKEAEEFLAADPGVDDARLVPVYNCYGCNMAVRAGVARKAGLQFDETLPLYGWLEDVDFSRGLAAFGQIVKAPQCRGVHRGVKRGRSTGVRLGYSQIANPIYLVRKNRMAPSRALAQMSRNLAQNLARSLRPEPWVDRKGRLMGNLRGLGDFVLGRLNPAKIVDMP